jgi:hypothetical protein
VVLDRLPAAWVISTSDLALVVSASCGESRTAPVPACEVVRAVRLTPHKIRCTFAFKQPLPITDPWILTLSSCAK